MDEYFRARRKERRGEGRSETLTKKVYLSNLTPQLVKIDRGGNGNKSQGLRPLTQITSTEKEGGRMFEERARGSREASRPSSTLFFPQERNRGFLGATTSDSR